MSANMAPVSTKDEIPQPRPRTRQRVPTEGADGVFSQTWFPLCRSREIPPGVVRGVPFLGGKVVVFRGEDGIARVFSAYCVHMGADLSGGCVVGNNIQCPFHRFEFGENGMCVKTGIGAPPPPRAQQFAFPVAEKWGLIWAFNGEEPLWELPDLQRPESDLIVIEREPRISSCEPYMVTANAFDWQHFGSLHDFYSSERMDEDGINWRQYSCGFRFEGKHWRGEDVWYDIEVYGTNIYLQQGVLDGRWYAMAVPMGLPRPGTSQTFMQIMVERGNTPEEELKARYSAEAIADLEIRFINQDEHVLNNIHFGQGHLVADDRQFSIFLNYLRKYPRGNPARDYLD